MKTAITPSYTFNPAAGTLILNGSAAAATVRGYLSRYGINP